MRHNGRKKRMPSAKKAEKLYWVPRKKTESFTSSIYTFDKYWHMITQTYPIIIVTYTYFSVFVY